MAISTILISQFRFVLAIFLLLPLTCEADDLYYANGNKLYKSASIAISVPVPATFIPIELEQVKWNKIIVITSETNEVRRIAFDDILSLHIAPLTLDDFSRIAIKDGKLYAPTGLAHLVRTYAVYDIPHAVAVTPFAQDGRLCTLFIPGRKEFIGSECSVTNVKHPSEIQSFRLNDVYADMIDTMSWINSNKVLCVSNSLRGNGAFIIDVQGKSSSARYVQGDYFKVENGKLLVLKRSDSGKYEAESIIP